MDIVTSYFAKVKDLKLAGIVPVAISLKPPHYFSGENVQDLAPTYPMMKLSKDGDDEGYTREFKKKLSSLNPTEVVENLRRISDEHGGMPVAILCYEKPSDFCHRHIVSDWLNTELGLEIREFKHSATQQEKLMENQRRYWGDE